MHTGASNQDQVDRLRTLAMATIVFHRSPKAQSIWARHRKSADSLPTVYVTAYTIESTVEGLVIAGDWDDEVEWDLDSRFTVLADDGVILTVNGWMATDIEVL